MVSCSPAFFQFFLNLFHAPNEVFASIISVFVTTSLYVNLYFGIAEIGYFYTFSILDLKEKIDKNFYDRIYHQNQKQQNERRLIIPPVNRKFILTYRTFLNRFRNFGRARGTFFHYINIYFSYLDLPTNCYGYYKVKIPFFKTY